MAATTKYLLALGALVVVGGGAYYFMHSQPTAPVATPVTTPAPAAAPAPAPAAPAVAATVPTDCQYPGPAPVAPDATISNAADMKLGHDTIQNYVQELENYSACRDNMADHTTGATDAQKNQWIADGNTAVDQAHAIADAFTAQLKIYKAAHPGS